MSMQCITHRSPLCTPAGEEQRQGVMLRVRSRVRPRVRLRVRPGPPTRARSAVGEPAPVCRILEAGHHTPNLGPREAAHTVLASRTAPVMEVPRVNTDVAPRWRPRRPGLATQSQVPSNYAQKYGSKTNCHNQETVANQSRIGVANSVRPALISVSQNGSSASGTRLLNSAPPLNGPDTCHRRHLCPATVLTVRARTRNQALRPRGFKDFPQGGTRFFRVEPET